MGNRYVVGEFTRPNKLAITSIEVYCCPFPLLVIPVLAPNCLGFHLLSLPRLSKYGTIAIPPIDMMTLNQPDVRGLEAGHSADVTHKSAATNRSPWIRGVWYTKTGYDWE